MRRLTWVLLVRYVGSRVVFTLAWDGGGEEMGRWSREKGAIVESRTKGVIVYSQ